MFQFVVVLEYITIIGLFVECWVSLRKWSSKLHSYLFFSCVANLVYNVGFLLELRARNQETYVMALKFAYFGRIWIGLSLFLFVMEVCRIKLPMWLTGLLAGAHAAMYASILNVESNDLYYDYMKFEMQGDFPHLIHSGGILYHLQTVLTVLYILFGVGLIIITLIREHNPIAKKRYAMVTIAMSAIGVAYITYILKLIPLAHAFDVTIFGFAVGTLFLLIAIFRYKMLDAVALARNYVVDELSEGIIVVDGEGKITYCNNPAIRLFPELGKGNLSGRSAMSVIERIRFAIRCEEPLKLNDRIYTPKTNALLQNGVTVGTLYVIVDDSDHYRYLEELREQKAIADGANKAKSQFLANMSHEIRTPINAILGMDEMVLRESSEPEIRDYAEDIWTSGKTLLALVNDILDFSKVEEGKMEIIPVTYEPGQMVSDIVNMIRVRAAAKGLRFEVDLDYNIPRLLKGDEIRIKQCALNLLNNAVKYTEKGTVSLKISFRETDKDHIELEFVIKDTGVGIRPEDMEDLFSPFKRIDEKKNRSIEGTGLGITITKRLLELMGSDLNVKSEFGNGSEFSFAVIQEIMSRETVGEYAKKSDGTREKKRIYKELFHAPDARILVIDDIRMNLTVITKLLKNNQMMIDTALSGPEGIKKAEENDYDIIFIDHLMPEMDGVETLKYLKEIPESENTIYIALTANAIAGAREMYLEEGFTDYISKPVEGELLEKLIMSYLPAEKLLDTPDSV
ncbi:MAG: response regulator [Lachnospiraceae bacterium]|nr:response regulator [Lachnospiraceae bacterium]